jgi:hypothetical protein
MAGVVTRRLNQTWIEFKLREGRYEGKRALLADVGSRTPVSIEGWKARWRTSTSGPS